MNLCGHCEGCPCTYSHMLELTCTMFIPRVSRWGGQWHECGFWGLWGKTMNKELWSVIFHTMSLRNAAIRCSSSHFVMFNTVNNINGLPNCMSFWVWAQSHHLLVLPHIVHESALGKITSSFIWPPSFLRILHYRSSYRHLCGNSSLLRINVTWSETILN